MLIGCVNMCDCGLSMQTSLLRLSSRQNLREPWYCDAWVSPPKVRVLRKAFGNPLPQGKDLEHQGFEIQAGENELQLVGTQGS